MNMSNVLAKISIVILLLVCLVGGAIYAATVASTNDDKAGTASADTIDLRGGDDRGTGFAGGDTIYGRTGNDILNGGPGVDALYGNDDSDHLLAQPNGSTAGDEDTLNCGAGEDFLYKAAGFDPPAANLTGCEHVAVGNLPSYPIQDPDADLYPNDGAFADNCPDTFNPPQTDTDKQYDDDAAGDSCDPDNDSNAEPPTPTGRYVEVSDFPGAVPNDSFSDTRAFQDAFAAAGAGETVHVSCGTWRVVGLEPPSNTNIDIESCATLKKYGNNNTPIFLVQGPNDTTFAENVNIQGVNGRFTLDLSDAHPQESTGFRFRNVKHFSLKNMDCRSNNSNTSGGPPTILRPCLTTLPLDTSRLPSGEYKAPYDGLFQNLHETQGAYGWGLTQISGGQDLTFKDISSDGGVALRLESFEATWTPIDDLYANDVTCTNGHEAVLLNPHNAIHGDFHITDVNANACEAAISVQANPANGSYGPGSTIDDVTVVAGNTAQVRDTSGPLVGSWTIGPARYCLDLEQGVNYADNLTITNLSCAGLPYDN